MRLIRKGNVLFKRKKEENCADSQGFQDENETGELLRLARGLVASKLTYDDKQEQEITERLTEFLDKEYKNNVERHGENKARWLMILKIRQALVQHPYDQIGRRMAIEIKDLFKRSVLRKSTLLHNLQSFFQLPSALKNHSRVKTLFLMMPLFIATFLAVKKGLVYSHDMVSDVLVLRELNENISTFKIPNITEMPAFDENKLLTFFLEDFQYYGLPAVQNPCEILDLIEDICEDNIVLYNFLLSNGVGIRWNPNRNSTLDITEPFKVLKVLPNIYHKVKTAMDKLHKTTRNLPFRDLNKDIEEAKRVLKEGIKMLKDADSGFSGFIVTLLGHDIDSENYIPIMESVIEILEITEEKVLNTPFVKKSLAVYRNFHLRNTNNSLGKWPSLVDTFTRQFLDNFNHDAMSSFKYVSLLQNTTYPLPKLNSKQEKCQKYVAKLFQLTEDEELKKALLYMLTESKNNIDNIGKGSIAKLKFYMTNTINCVYYFLILSLFWTLLTEVKNAVKDYIRYKHIPFVTDFQPGWQKLAVFR